MECTGCCRELVSYREQHKLVRIIFSLIPASLFASQFCRNVPQPYITFVREFALYVGGDLVSQAAGHVTSKRGSSLPTESDLVHLEHIALARCAKDLGVASEVWDSQVSGILIRCSP